MIRKARLVKQLAQTNTALVQERRTTAAFAEKNGELRQAIVGLQNDLAAQEKTRVTALQTVDAVRQEIGALEARISADQKDPLARWRSKVTDEIQQMTEQLAEVQAAIEEFNQETTT